MFRSTALATGITIVAAVALLVAAAAFAGAESRSPALETSAPSSAAPPPSASESGSEVPGPPPSGQAAAEAFLDLSTSSLSFDMLPPEVPRAQILEGVVSGDATDYLLMVSSPNSTAGQALQCRSRDGTITRGRPIPVKWQLRYRDGVRWTEWLDPQSERSGVDTPGASCFHLTGHQAAYDVQLRCEVEPQPMQLCGAYVGSVRIDVRPVTGTELPAYSGPSREGGGEATCR